MTIIEGDDANAVASDMKVEVANAAASDVKVEVKEPTTNTGDNSCRGGVIAAVVFSFVTLAVAGVTLGIAVDTSSKVDKLEPATTSVALTAGATISLSTNPCKGKKPTTGFENKPCEVGGVVKALEQAGADVTRGYVGGLATTKTPITKPYWEAGLCPVNVHWHLGAEHRSKGEFDENGKGPKGPSARRLAGGELRLGLQCHHYDKANSMFTTEYKWKHCVNMQVGQTYEVHWPHSALGACGTPHQYQHPFYDGVFCNINLLKDTASQIGVQAQVFTIVNSENYYYPDLIRGMIVDGDFGKDIAKYTGSTTGTTRNNEICSAYTPITWQVDRKCHLISASSFDKMCADMKAQPDDMSADLAPGGARELVANKLAANNLQNRV